MRQATEIDLVVQGLPTARYFEELSRVCEMTRFAVDLRPYEDANSLVRDIVAEAGVEL